MCMDELSEIMYLVGQIKSEGKHFGVPQRQQEKRDAIKITDKRIVKGKQSEWTITLKANGPQAPETLLTTLKGKK